MIRRLWRRYQLWRGIDPLDYERFNILLCEDGSLDVNIYYTRKWWATDEDERTSYIRAIYAIRKFIEHTGECKTKIHGPVTVEKV